MSSTRPTPPGAIDTVPAVIMCGGRGTRLHPLTNDLIPKGLVRVGDRTLLEHTLTALHREGVRRVVLAVAHHADQIRHAIGIERCGVEISYYQPTHAAAAGLLQDLTGACAQAGFTGDVLLAGCDELCDGLDLGAAYAFHRSMRATATLLVAEDIPLIDRHVDATLDDRRCVRSLVKPAALAGRYGVLGISVLSQRFLHLARALTPDPDLDDRAALVRRLLPSLIREGRLAAYRCRPRFYLHVGTPDAYARAIAWCAREADAFASGRADSLISQS